MNSERTCSDCGKEMSTKNHFVHPSYALGEITIDGIDFNFCENCCIELVPNEIMKEFEKKEKQLVLERLTKRLVSIEDINEQYMNSKELSKHLKIPQRRLYQKNLQTSVLHNLIYNIKLFGRCYYLRESVERFLKEKDGRFLL